MSMKTHYLHLYTGTGKGKTSAAMGLALRALGHGKRVLIAQFLKDGTSGELVSLRRLGAEIYPSRPVSGFVSRMSEAERLSEKARQTENARALTDHIASCRPDLVILDELAVALDLGMVDRADAEALLDEALSFGETAATGRNAPQWLRERADYLSEIEAVRHPYRTEGLAAREGVEW